ncbi:hypothetical protein BO221_48010 [Archangium sp. Cb G35]|uniref:AbiTii domain-containing protein n=1 Tax=Archangium sp. Cb G35 TaxID=1920190 RepID=UPI00093759D8|nr:hypothetical protein [Archangium sp. Cb G35]OJT16854.1 hypothetical protein BO221_48010 [Archangium sp. Cb G35]
MPTPSLVDELIRLAQDDDTSLSELLRRTRVLAAKLKIPEMEAWVKNETSGYNRGNSEVPDYRRIPCELKALNIVRGWIPVLLGDEEHFRTVDIHQSVAEIETLLESESSDRLSAHVSSGEHTILAQAIPELRQTQVARIIGRASLKGVLEAVRNRVLEAALELDSKGIRGEGLSFSDEERAKAAAVTTSIVNNIYGDNANIASAAHSPNAGAAFASGSATINQHIGNIQQGNQELANAFKSVLEALKTDASLEPAKRAEAEQQLAFLAEQAAKPEEKRQPKAVVKPMLLALRETLGLSADLLQVWSTFGPVICAALAVQGLG